MPRSASAFVSAYMDVPQLIGMMTVPAIGLLKMRLCHPLSRHYGGYAQIVLKNIHWRRLSELRVGSFMRSCMTIRNCADTSAGRPELEITQSVSP